METFISYPMLVVCLIGSIIINICLILIMKTLKNQAIFWKNRYLKKEEAFLEKEYKDFPEKYKILFKDYNNGNFSGCKEPE